MTENKNLALILSKCDDSNKGKIRQISNIDILATIVNRIELCNPKDIFVHTGSDADCAYIKKMALEVGEETKLAMGGHTIHFDPPSEQGRVVKQTYAVETEWCTVLCRGERRPPGEPAPAVCGCAFQFCCRRFQEKCFGSNVDRNGRRWS